MACEALPVTARECAAESKVAKGVAGERGAGRECAAPVDGAFGACECSESVARCAPDAGEKRRAGGRERRGRGGRGTGEDLEGVAGRRGPWGA